MRKLALTLGSLAVIGFAIPMTLPADAATIVIKKGDARGHHYGWDRGHCKTVIIRRGERD